MTPPALGPRRRRPWWLRSAVRLGVALVVAAAVVSYLIYRTDAAVREAQARLDRDDPGWRLEEIEAARETIPDEENSARVAVAAAELLPVGGGDAEWYEVFRKPPAPGRLERSEYARLRVERDLCRAALREARKLIGLPRGRYGILFWPSGEPVRRTGSDQNMARSVAALLYCDALVRADEGDAAGALAACRGIVNAGRSVGDEPDIRSQLNRDECVWGGCWTAGRVLARAEPTAPELAALQHLLESEDAYPWLRVCLRAGRAEWHEQCIAALGRQDPGLRDAFRRARVKAAYPGTLSLLSRYVDATRLPTPERLAAEAALNAESDAAAAAAAGERSRFLPPGVPQPVLGGLVVAHRNKRAWLRSMIACLAAERYRRAHGRWPEALTDLVPGQLAAVPVDPHDGQPLRYRRLADGVVAYSVGTDGKDDGGRIFHEEPSKCATDVGFRLWDPAHRAHPPAAVPPRVGQGGGP